MRTTRRAWLTLLGASAAVAAVPSDVAASPEPDAVQAAYEQGRADGYNRGREVEAAAQEARLAQA